MVSEKPNVLFLLIDALRFDVFSDMEYLRRIAPNLAGLADRGSLRRVINNGHATKFVMPALFTQTYPLDYGGYSGGIHERPKSFVELIRAAGWKTRLYLGHDLDGPLGGVERGFDEVALYYDVDLPLHSYLRDIVPHEIASWRKGTISESALIEWLQSTMDPLLAATEESVNRPRDPSLHRRLAAAGPHHAGRYRAERSLLATDPVAVVNKITSIPPNFYPYYLGRRRAGASLLVRRLAFAARARLQNSLRRVLGVPLQLLSHRVPPTAQEIVGSAVPRLSRTEGPWFTYIHVMDLHDCMVLKRPRALIARCWTALRLQLSRAPKSLRSAWYDSALRAVDRQIGAIVEKLRAEQLLGSTVVLVTGDHGYLWDPARDPSLQKDFGFRTHREFVDVPLLLVGGGNISYAEGLLDSMSVSATLLEALGIDPHVSFRGQSAYASTREIVVNENAGRGRADLDTSTLYFTVVSKRRKLMVRLDGNELVAVRFYDCEQDPRELRNIVDDPARADEIDALLTRLLDERAPIFERRGVAVHSESVAE